MIFVTVGHQMPFDRLVRNLDVWASRHPDVEVFAQIGESAFVPRSMQWAKTLDPDDFRRKVMASEAIVAHAGTGVILTALQHSVPILVMPRRAFLLETRNDHQVATASRFGESGRIAVAKDESELGPALDLLRSMDRPRSISAFASPSLIHSVRCAIGLQRIDDQGSRGDRGEEHSRPLSGSGAVEIRKMAVDACVREASG